MARREKKPGPDQPATRRVLPTQLQVGDRLADETGEWEVTGRPFTTAGGKTAHARVNRSTNPTSRRSVAGAPTSGSA